MELTITNISALTILAISFERYYAICHPLHAGYTCTRSRAVKIIIIIWLVASTITSPIIQIVEFKHTKYLTDGSNVPVCVTQAINVHTRVFFYAMMTLFFLFPLIILLVIYTVITKNLMAERPANYSSTRDLTSLSSKPKNERTSHVARKQVVTMLGAVVVCFFVCLAPLRGFQIWILVSKAEDLTNAGVYFYYNILYFCRVMFHINSAINPVLYNLISSKFRKAFKKQVRTMLFCSSGQRVQSNRSTLNTTSSNLMNHSDKCKGPSYQKKVNNDFI